MAFGDSISGLFAGVFGVIYSDGTLQSYALSDDGSGSVSRTTTSHAIKYQLDQTKARHERDPGIPRGDARVIVLRHNTHEPRKGDALHIGGDVYTIVSVQAAPANTHWTIEAQKNGHSYG